MGCVPLNDPQKKPQTTTAEPKSIPEKPKIPETAKPKDIAKPQIDQYPELLCFVIKNEIHVYNMANGDYKRFSYAKFCDTDPPFVQMSNWLLFAGGILNGQPQKNCLLFTIEAGPKLSQPSRTQPMAIPKTDNALVGVGGEYVYSVGGSAGNVCLTTCERYKISENRWDTVPPLNTGRSLVACCTYNNKVIYAFGGKTTDLSYLPDHEWLDVTGTSGWVQQKIESCDDSTIFMNCVTHQDSDDILLCCGTHKLCQKYHTTERLLETHMIPYPDIETAQPKLLRQYKQEWYFLDTEYTIHKHSVVTQLDADVVPWTKVPSSDWMKPIPAIEIPSPPSPALP